jgi:MFS family permease
VASLGGVIGGLLAGRLSRRIGSARIIWYSMLVFGTLAGVRATLWIAYAGSWAAGWWVFFSPLRRQRDLDDGATSPPARPRRQRGLEDSAA